MSQPDDLGKRQRRKNVAAAAALEQIGNSSMGQGRFEQVGQQLEQRRSQAAQLLANSNPRKRKSVYDQLVQRRVKSRVESKIDVKKEMVDVDFQDDSQFHERKIISQPVFPNFEGRVTAPDLKKFPNGLVKPSDSNVVKVNIFWFDCYEDRIKQPGRIFLFGRIKHQNRLLSCCLVVENIPRHIYIIPKDQEISQEEMDEEIKSWAVSKKKSTRWRFVKRRYCFEKSGVPRDDEFECVELFFSASNPTFELPSNSKCFSRIFGMYSSQLEETLVSKNIRGPCWLSCDTRLENVSSYDKISHCEKEFVADFDKLKLFKDKRAPRVPPLSVLSLKIHTLNRGVPGSKNEIVSVHGIFHPFVRVDGPTPNPEEGFLSFALIRPFQRQIGIPSLKKRRKTDVAYVPSEKNLLEQLFIRLGRLQPDILVGHNFLAYDLDILLHRSKDCGVSHQWWSQLGRLKRRKMPRLQPGIGGTQDATYQEKMILSGRLVCDTYLGAKEHLKEKSYSLANLVKSKLDSNILLERIDNDLHSIRSYFQGPEQITRYLEHGEQMCYLSLKLMFKLALLPMTKELTCIAGNLWSKTLVGSRAKRIEVLLVHEFSAKGFIVPDQFSPKKKKSKFSFKRGKAKYGGGLVLEPKRGLYETYVLLLDFNSLYPSIILEKNLCFSTVERPLEKDEEEEEDDEDKMDLDIRMGDIKMEGEGEVEKKKVVKEEFFAEVPSEDHPMYKHAVLPEVLDRLLKRRRAVKKIMAKEREESMKWLLNIRQLALKLTANSTYGCLGFVHSRFYCQPIAELITRQGRLILQQTKDDVENNLGKKIVYGDTDSVMVLTQEIDFKKAIKIGEEIKAHVNKNTKHLEIDIDGLFRRMLLLRKKKYVAEFHLKDPFAPGGVKISQEIKGVDMVRRDWCNLSQGVSKQVVNEILSGKNRDEMVGQIHLIMTKIAEEVRQGKRPLEDFILSKGLTKPPEQYPDGNSLPHVKVAKEMQEAGKLVKPGMRILYLACLTQNPANSLSERCFSLEDYRKKTLMIDYEWYLENQVLPPIGRLCEVIEGTSFGQLADCLGLDRKKFDMMSSTGNVDFFDEGGFDENAGYVTLSAVVDDSAEKFKDCRLLAFNCFSCGCEVDFTIISKKIQGRLVSSMGNKLLPELSLLQCDGCKSKLVAGRIVNHVQKNIRYQLRRFYENQGRIVDHGLRSHSSVYSRTPTISMTRERGIIEGGVVPIEPDYPASLLLLHLQYFRSLFDWEYIQHAMTKRFNPENVKKKQLDIDLCYNQILEDCKEDVKVMRVISHKINRYVGRCGRTVVSLSKLFRNFE